MRSEMELTNAGPPCAFGEVGLGWSGPHHCFRCCAETDAAVQRFEAGVVAGTWDAEGYTPNERRALEKRKR